MKPARHTALSAEWRAGVRRGDFQSPSKDAGPNQVVLFDKQVADGAIEADITPLAGQPDENWGHELRECCFVVRHNAEGYYIGGIGGFGRKYFIARVTGTEWKALNVGGDILSLRAHDVYSLRLEFVKDRLSLLHNGVPVLSVSDNVYAAGLCGLRVNRTEARFTKVDINPAKQSCFVIMPFREDLKTVYDVIKRAIERHGFVCQRSDERFVSAPIMEDVKNQIAAADLVVIDFTGRNPNVYFEAGLADAWKKKWIVLAQSADDLTFDVQHIRSIRYEMGANAALRANLEVALKQTLEARASETPFRVSSP